MIPFQTHSNILHGSSSEELENKVKLLYKRIKARTKRKPYIRSAYFRKDKIFFDFFWRYLNQNNRKTKTKRLKYFTCALDLIRHCHNNPVSKENPNSRREILHRFYGLTKEKHLFCVQIKEIKKTGTKYLMSIFPLG